MTQKTRLTRLRSQTTSTASRLTFHAAISCVMIHLATGAALMGMLLPGIRASAWAAGSDAPEKKEVRIGFILLTDCSSVVMAAVNKFDEKYGIKIILTKEVMGIGARQTG